MSCYGTGDTEPHRSWTIVRFKLKKYLFTFKIIYLAMMLGWAGILSLEQCWTMQAVLTTTTFNCVSLTQLKITMKSFVTGIPQGNFYPLRFWIGRNLSLIDIISGKTNFFLLQLVFFKDKPCMLVIWSFPILEMSIFPW